ncbi:MAG: ABC transporter ATP-binding protein [Phycisphaerales bacterium]
MLPPILDVSSFRKTYDRLVAVDDLSFRVDAGQVVGLIGPNGAGKTTTMRAVAGIIPAARGAIRVHGFDVRDHPVEAKARLAYVPDDPRLFDTLTVWEHMRFIASAYDVRGWEPDAEALLKRFELVEKRSATAQELSRGMRQKLAICCAYLHRPSLVMFDEPMTGLDPHAIRELKESIREQAGRGTGFLVSSHLLALVEDLTTHILILHRGARLFFGSLDQARASFAGDDASLEAVFFRATESAARASTGAPPPPPIGPSAP